MLWTKPGDDAARSVTRFIGNLTTHSTATLAACIASRPYSETGRLILSSKDYGFTISLEKCNEQDIQAFVDAEFSPFQDHPDSAGINMIKQRLVQKTNGVFQWLKWSTPKALSLLDDTEGGGESPQYVLKQIEGYPKGLEQVYERLLNSIDGELEVALRLFECLAIALGPISADDLRHLVCIEPGQAYQSIADLNGSQHFCERSQQIRGRIQRLSQGLVRPVALSEPASARDPPRSIWPEQGPALQFDHDSVRSYMLEKGLTLLQRRLCQKPSTLPERHFEMAMKCLLYLQVEDVAGYDDNLVSDESDQSSDGKTWYKDLPGPRETQPPFSRYAALQWFEHARIAEQDAAFCDRLLRYLSEAETHLYGLLAVLYESAIEEYWTEAWANSSLIHPLSCFGLAKILSLHLRRLKSAGPDYAYRTLLDASNGEGTALAIAAQFGRVSVVELLLSLGADVCYEKMLGTTALHYAATEGHLDVIEVLLRHPQTDPNETDRLGRTALGSAAVRSHLPIVQRLAAVTKSAVFAKPSTRVYFLPGPKEGRGWQMDTPLGLALWAGNPEVMEVLLARGLPGDIQETAGEDSMLHLVSIYSGSSTHPSSEKLDLLLASGKFNTNLRGWRGETPLYTAVERRHHNVVARLLRCNDIDITISNDNDDTPLSLALRSDDQTMLEIFRESGMVDPSYLCPDRPLSTPEE